MLRNDYTTEERNRRNRLSLDTATEEQRLRRFLDRYQSSGQIHNLKGAIAAAGTMLELLEGELKEASDDDEE